MTTQREMIARRCDPDRLSGLTIPATKRALRSMVERFHGDERFDNDYTLSIVTDVLSQYAADVIAVAIMVAMGESDRTIRELDAETTSID